MQEERGRSQCEPSTSRVPSLCSACHGQQVLSRDLSFAEAAILLRRTGRRPQGKRLDRTLPGALGERKHIWILAGVSIASPAKLERWTLNLSHKPINKQVYIYIYILLYRHIPVFKLMPARRRAWPSLCPGGGSGRQGGRSLGSTKPLKPQTPEILRMSSWEVPKIRGTLFWGPYQKDPTI